MLFVRLEFDSDFHWRLNSFDPLQFPVSGTDDWNFVSPLVYGNFDLIGSSSFVEYDPGKFFGSSTGIVFVRHDVNTTDWESSGESDRLVKLAMDLLTRLRHLAGQATIPQPKNFVCIASHLADAVPIRSEPVSPLGRYSVQEYTFGVAITGDHIRDAAKLGSNYDPPIYEVLLLTRLRLIDWEITGLQYCIRRCPSR